MKGCRRRIIRIRKADRGQSQNLRLSLFFIKKHFTFMLQSDIILISEKYIYDSMQSATAGNEFNFFKWNTCVWEVNIWSVSEPKHLQRTMAVREA